MGGIFGITGLFNTDSQAQGYNSQAQGQNTSQLAGAGQGQGFSNAQYQQQLNSIGQYQQQLNSIGQYQQQLNSIGQVQQYQGRTPQFFGIDKMTPDQRETERQRYITKWLTIDPDERENYLNMRRAEITHA